MLSEIYLKCDHCDQAYNYKFNENYLIALNSEWRENIDKKSIISKTPKKNNHYILTITGPLKLNLNNKFWSIYMRRYSQLNGIESELDIESISFCLNQTLEVISLNNKVAKLKIKVIKVVGINNLSQIDNPKIQWIDLLENNYTSKYYYSIFNFLNYSLIKISIQGDLGLSLIIKKNNKKSEIIAINEWDFHRDIWYGYSKILTKEEELKYRIIHF